MNLQFWGIWDGISNGKEIGQAMMVCTCEKYVKWWGNENMWTCGEEEGNIGGSKMDEGKRK